MPFACSICEQESTRICAFCTKDACDMHICEKCGCCSDCCQCEVPLEEPVHPHADPPAEHVAVPPEAVVETSLPETSDVAWAPPEPQPATPEESAFEPLETPEV